MEASPSYRLSHEDQQQLLKLARRSISYYLETKKLLLVSKHDYSKPLQARAASFVTLTLDDALRGCIGTTEAYQSLITDVVANAHGAAFRDRRFQPLSRKEFDAVSIEISVLTPLEEMPAKGSANILELLKPGLDGLLISQGGHKATFLPSVWKSLPEPEQFLQQLKSKAGIPANEPDNQLRAWRYRSFSFEEPQNTTP